MRLLSMGGRIEVAKLFKKLIPYEDHVEVDGFRGSVIGGFLVEIGEVDEEDPKFRSYILQKSYQNFINAVYRVGIPLTMIYSLINKGENLVGGLYILTKGRDEDELNKRLNVIESTLYAVFPKISLKRLRGEQIKEILLLGKPPKAKNSTSTPPIIYEQNLPTESPIVDSPRFYIPVIEEARDSHKIILGKVLKEGFETSLEYSITVNEIKSHLVSLGVTGSGKTTTVATILNQLPDNINYLVLDFHNEYARLLKNYSLILKPGKDPKSAINPLDASFVADIGEHIALITDIFSDTYSFTHPQSYLFKLALEATLSNYRMYGASEPNLKVLINIIEEYPIKSYYDNETKMALLRRLKPLTEGQAEKAFISSKYVKVDELVRNNVIIELGHFRETKMRQIYSQILLKKIFDYRLSMGSDRFNHIIVIEEARYIVPSRRDYDQPSVAERMINELRKFGESIFIITQFPSQISKESIKNASMIIIHRLGGLEDLRILQNIIAIDDDQLNYLKKLDVGEAIVKDPRYPSPIHVKIIPH